jgi:hypothetical protein
MCEHEWQGRGSLVWGAFSRLSSSITCPKSISVEERNTYSLLHPRICNACSAAGFLSCSPWGESVPSLTVRAPLMYTLLTRLCATHTTYDSYVLSASQNQNRKIAHWAFKFYPSSSSSKGHARSPR